MDETLRHHNPNPIASANFLSRTFFWWLNPLLKTGYSRQLETEDMYNVVEQDASSNLGNRLEDEWKKEIKKQKETGKKPSLMRALARCFGVQYMLLGIIVFIEEGTKVVQPLLLGGLIRFFTPESTISKEEAYLYAMAVSICAIVLAVAHHPYFFSVTRIGMQMRVACCSLMYKKSLRLSNKALGQTTVGQIVNLMSNDVNRFDQAVIFLHFLWIGPVQAIAVLVILWYELGPAVLAGFAVLILLIPLQGWMGKLFSILRQKTAKHTDERVRVMNEIISGMRVIKMYCWEKPFGDLVEKIRSPEIRWHKWRHNCNGFLSTLRYSSVAASLLAIMLVLVLMSCRVSTRIVFTARLYMGVTGGVLVGAASIGVQQLSELRVGISRIKTFLCLEELDESSLVEKSEDHDRPPVDQCFVNIDNVTAKWDKNVDQNTLDKISASVKAGELLAVIGPVGAGKSSLLMSILGELPTSEGKIQVKGKIAYVSQQPWVFSASVRQNVTMGELFDATLYEKSLRACALKKDVGIMPHGDSTRIGDRGVSLSGGQRARVNLARALYTDADIYLLDDPLSAVDAAVGRHIFEKCIQGTLKKKPRILVTHQVQYLKEADQILILKEGKLLGTGTFEELSKSGIDFASLLKHDDEDEDDSAVMMLPDTVSTSHVNFNELGSSLSLASIASDFVPEKIQVQEEEQRQEGTVGFGVYVKYFKAGTGIFMFILLVLLNLLAQTAYIMSDWWLSRWSNEEELRYAATQVFQEQMTLFNSSNITVPEVDTNVNIYIFTSIVVSVFLFGLLRALLFFKIAVDASQALHNRMFAKILRAPISFFDNNPVGRILNRFSKDVGHMDDLLPITFFDFVQCFLLIIGIIIVAGVINPWVFIPTVPLCVLFIFIRRYYLRSSRSVKRLEGTTRSPVFSHLSASLQGLHTIRAMSIEDKFMSEFDAHQDLHTESWFLFLSTSRWLAVRLDWLCAIFVTAVAFCSVLSADRMDAGLVGLSITYAMTLMGLFQWGVRQSAEVENQMISVERVLEYSQLPSEAPLDSSKDNKPPPNWPQHGIISGEKASLKYSQSGPNVLKDINFCVRAQEKVGIVGRTGAGKSSMIVMLFRLVEPKGKLMIDGINISDIGLHDLRKTISIIPQDPVLFTGALRRNLDPFGQHDDSQLWKSLEEVQLKPAVEELPGQLETEVSEGGINFSVGQRQLICLARAILRKNKILLIDEATANVDPKTDELIQATIRDKFRHCTVLTIAHRLHTIMDSDRVLVMDDGKIIDFDEPHLLLEKGEGHFYQMVQQTGKTEAEHLIEIAETAYKDRHTSQPLDDKVMLTENGMTYESKTDQGNQNEMAEELDSAISSSSIEENAPMFETVPSEPEDMDAALNEPLLDQDAVVKKAEEGSVPKVNGKHPTINGAGNAGDEYGMPEDSYCDDDIEEALLTSEENTVELTPSTPIVSIAKQKRGSKDLSENVSSTTPLLTADSQTADSIDV
ncbi:ATP-binding cassette sub-family C member 4-like isoform X3 [Haliotis rufescens]|uniref:ATP-binding cassette sub-family C member 4-like isoform X3 n=1 Tax=Haliotis rufescens TaxID=6454 RepID=UPI00201FAD94|nr:ATP-binding cassette sub-family C member 4-like isoform X3 [Haliotis rufescens]